MTPDDEPGAGEPLTVSDLVSPRDHLDALLESPHLTSDQTSAAIDDLSRRAQATYPHLVIATATVHARMPGLDDEDPEMTEQRFYYGPFKDRAAAERWAHDRFDHIERFTWEAEQLVTEDRDRRQMEEHRRLFGED